MGFESKNITNAKKLAAKYEAVQKCYDPQLESLRKEMSFKDIAFAEPVNLNIQKCRLGEKDALEFAKWITEMYEGSQM